MAVAQPPAVQDATTQRALDVLTSAVQDLQARRLGGAVVTGSRGSGAALESLLEQLVALGLIEDETTV